MTLAALINESQRAHGTQPDHLILCQCYVDSIIIWTYPTLLSPYQRA